MLIIPFIPILKKIIKCSLCVYYMQVLKHTGECKDHWINSTKCVSLSKTLSPTKEQKLTLEEKFHLLPTHLEDIVQSTSNPCLSSCNILENIAQYVFQIWKKENYTLRIICVCYALSWRIQKWMKNEISPPQFVK